MSYPAPVSLLGIDRQPDKAPILLADAPGDGPSWAAEHKDALRAVVAEHGSVMVRGLELRDAAEVTAVFRQLSTGLMIEREAFASRRIYSDGVYSSATWPANQPMCMHHELSYTARGPRPDAVRLPQRSYRGWGDGGVRFARGAQCTTRRAGRPV